jgi:hypothetical protein
MKTMADRDPNIEKIDPVGVGNVVKFTIRIGSMRQGRTTFPALVFMQHPDDGTLDLLVFFEAEDILWERRVHRKQSDDDGHVWEPLDHRPLGPYEVEAAAMLANLKQALTDGVNQLTLQIFGEYDQPEKSVIEYLADFDTRLSKIERRLGQTTRK